MTSKALTTIDTKAVGSVTKYASKLEKERRKTIREQELWLLLRQAAASPLFQIIGGITLTEAAQSVGILDSKWAGGIEGGIIAMVALQALKDFGVIGAAALGYSSALGIGVSTGLAGDLVGAPVDLTRYIRETLQTVIPGL